MDLVAGAKRVIVAMEHTTRDGGHKIVDRCTLPLTGLGVVDLIVTEMAVIEVTDRGLVLKEVADDTTAEDVKAATGAELHHRAGAGNVSDRREIPIGRCAGPGLHSGHRLRIREPTMSSCRSPLRLSHPDRFVRGRPQGR